MEKFVVTIDGRKYEGAPTMTQEEVQNAFNTALSERPEIRKECERNNLICAILRTIGGDSTELETGRLSDENDLMRAKWEEWHGIVSDYIDGVLRLIAWTADGEVIGPTLDRDSPLDDELAFSVERGRIFQDGGLEWEEITINDESYRCMASFIEKEMALDAVEAAFAEWSDIQLYNGRLRERIKSLESTAGRRMRHAIQKNEMEISRRVRSWEKRHNVSLKFYMEDELLHITARTKEGITVGPGIERTGEKPKNKRRVVMREEIKKADGTLVGWMDEDGSGTVLVYSADGEYKGYANGTGTYSSRGGFVIFGKHPEMLLVK